MINGGTIIFLVHVQSFSNTTFEIDATITCSFVIAIPDLYHGEEHRVL